MGNAPHSLLTIDQPEDQRKHNAEKQARGNWDVYGKILALDQNIARQSSQANARKPRPDNTDRNDNKTDNDQGSGHPIRTLCVVNFIDRSNDENRPEF
jgi:hypothetical protein